MREATCRQAPTAAVLSGFAGGRPARPLPGGSESAWISGDVVLKPSPGAAEARCLAESHADLREARACRFQRPVPAAASERGWEIDGWIAWRWIEGKTAPGRAREIVLAGRAYHALLKPMPGDPALLMRNDPWARADRVAWGEAPADYPDEYRRMLAPFLAGQPPALPQQRVHADLTGNVVFAPDLAPGIIDPTLYWRPTAFAEAVVLVDQVWFSDTPDLEAFSDTPALLAMLRRAAARRIAEQPEQVAVHRKSAGEAMATACEIARWTHAALARLGVE